VKKTELEAQLSNKIIKIGLFLIAIILLAISALWFVINKQPPKSEIQVNQKIDTNVDKVSQKSSQENYVVGPTYNCSRLPRFLRSTGLSQPIAIDTAQSRHTGLILRELRSPNRVYQHKSWLQTGHVGGTVRDRQGNIYVIPIPTIGLDTNPLALRNRIYIVDSLSGVMSVYKELPLVESDSSNPFGTLGMTIDCETNSLYVSSVAGSTVDQQKGVIYQINLSNKQIVDTLEGVDAIGLGIFNFKGEKRLYFGSARDSSLFSYKLTKKGSFVSFEHQPRYETSLLSLKNGNTTQIKKIRFSKSKNQDYWMQLSETEFGFRLSADTGRQYKHYLFKLNLDTKYWKFTP